MPLVRWCDACWHENPYTATACEACGADLLQRSGDRVGGLIRSLDHPLPEVRRLAAVLLGPSDHPRALQALDAHSRVAVARKDWELLEGIVEGLAASNGAETIAILAFISHNGSVRARHAARRAIVAIKGREAVSRRSSDSEA